MVQGSWHKTQKVFALEQTADGFLWAATDGGLLRFDGRDFVTLTSAEQPGLRSNVVRALYKDRTGALWLGLDDGAGVARVTDGNVEAISTGKALAGRAILAMTATDPETLWIGTSSGLFVLRLGSNPGCEPVRELGEAPIYALQASRDGGVWVGARSGLFHITAGAAKRVGDLGPIAALAEDGEGKLWVSAVKAGVYSIAPTGETTLRLATNSERAGGAGFTALAIDGAGGVWVGWNGGYGRLVDGQLVQRFFNGLATVALRRDTEGGMWIATYWGVVIRVGHSRVKMETHSAGDEAPLVFGLAVDTQNALWMTQLKSVVARSKSGDRRYESGRELATWCPRGVYPARTGGVWLGTCDQGTFHIRGDHVERVGDASSLALRNIQTLLEDVNGDLWLGTLSGDVYVRRLGKDVRVPFENGACVEPDKSVDKTPRVDDECEFSPTAIINAKEGGVWISLRRNGLRRVWQGGSVSFFKQDGLPTNDLISLYQDKAGTLWIGTQAHGLVRFRNGAFHVFDRAAGLSAQSVHGIAEDDQGQLWISSENGVARVLKKHLDDFADGRSTRISSHTYGVADGLASPITVQSFTSPLLFHDGQVLVPLDKGLASLSSRDVDDRTGFSNVQLESVRLNGVVSDAKQAVKGDLPPGGLGALEFTVALPNFEVPHRVDVEYRLAPLETAWRLAGGERLLRYANLGPGTYSFEARPVLDGQTWGAVTRSKAIRLRGFRERPTFWFLVAAAVLPVLGIVAMVRLRYHRLKMETVLQERNRVARELHDTLAQYFTGISYHLARLTQVIPSDPQEADKITEETKMILSQCRLEARHAIHDLRASTSGDHSLVASLKRLADETRLSGDVNVDFNVSGEEWKLDENSFRQLTRIAQEAIVNSLAHAQASCLTIIIKYTATDLTLEVSDDGEGFDAQDSAKPLHFGLQGLQERADSLAAELTLTSSLGSGTTVKVVVQRKSSGIA